MAPLIRRRELRALGLRFDASRGALVPLAAPESSRPQARRLRPTLREAEIRTHREGDVLHLVLPTPPRTKKNHTEWLTKQSAGYRRFVADVRGVVLPRVQALRLPLPEVPYNCAVRFFYDRSEPDAAGLYQGLADALQTAGVIANDVWIKTWNGSEPPMPDAARPRVELVLSPLPSRQGRWRRER